MTLIPLGRACGEFIEAITPLAGLLFVAIFARGVVWIIGSLANG